MKSVFLRLVPVAVLLSVIGYQPSAFSQGALTPPGAPAPTMKSLAQIEPRTPISGPTFIETSGSYYLTKNIVATNADINVITINVSGVSLDLNGYTITSNRAAGSVGILMTSDAHDVTIMNGHIIGPFITVGISGQSSANVRLSNITVYDTSQSAILISTAFNNWVENCTVVSPGGTGILANNISHSQATGCAFSGIVASQLADNCVGHSVTGSSGVQASNAINCNGFAEQGTGVKANTAANCYGRGGIRGMEADVADHCYALGYGDGGGLLAKAAMTCFCQSAGVGVALTATIANSCVVVGPSAITNKYDMP